MPRHVLQPLPRAFSGHREAATRRQQAFADEAVWERMDRVQVLGGRAGGHRGCINALSWSDDGSTLLSGSDDKRICIWTADPASSSSSSSNPSPSPHPLKLLDAISTGHRANIFSARFLPNTSSPTIVSCAGDRDVRVFEVERLGREEVGRGRAELWGHDGAGVRILRCHHDRTKRIATENSPFLFLTVSEDGTVRQHDLRRPHRCRDECPEPLFHAPRGVDLYSLSVSTVTPHMFAVAGRTDCAFVCDRRMPERQSPSWGPSIAPSGQVHCVRRLGLPDEEWRKVAPRREGRAYFGGERHITCVKMSPHKADEVICSFAKHSTSLFSLFDSPGSSSMRAPVPQLSPLSPHRAGCHAVIPAASQEVQTGQPAHMLPEEEAAGKHVRSPSKGECGKSTVSPTAQAELPIANGEASSPGLGKRRLSELSIPGDAPSPSHRARTDGVAAEAGGPSPSTGGGPSRIGRPNPPLNEVGAEPQYEPPDPPHHTVNGAGSGGMAMGQGEEQEEEDDRRELRYESDVEPDPPAPSGFVIDPQRDDDLEALLDLAVDEIAAGSDLPAANSPVRPLYDILENEDDDLDMENAFDEMAEEEMELDEFDDEDDADEDALGDAMHFGDLVDDDEMYGAQDSLSEAGEFGGVEMILPRRSFRGARNVETVKDCNFLGAMSDKICSGSDDGHFFVWDKATGRLEGIWEGDGSVVNVIEQHPTLPLVAVSGIDNTVKMFAPVANAPDPSFRRMHLRDSIIKANTEPPTFSNGSAFGRVSLIELLASRGITMRAQGGDEDEAAQQCATQ